MYKSTRDAFLFLSFMVAVLVGLACVRLRECPGLVRRSYHAFVLGDKDFMNEEVRFRMRFQGTTLLPNGLLGGFTTVRASDCVDATSEVENEGSTVEAVDEMNKKVHAAVQVVEKGPLVDSQGGALGERAVLRVKSTKGEPSIEIVKLYKDKAKLYLIQSTSLAHALGYEKMIRGGYRLDSDGYLILTGK